MFVIQGNLPADLFGPGTNLATDLFIIPADHCVWSVQPAVGKNGAYTISNVYFLREPIGDAPVDPVEPAEEEEASSLSKMFGGSAVKPARDAAGGSLLKTAVNKPLFGTVTKTGRFVAHTV